jgi:hypothetical protein
MLYMARVLFATSPPADTMDGQTTPLGTTGFDVVGS